jgi:HEAT repeat protein
MKVSLALFGLLLATCSTVSWHLAGTSNRVQLSAVAVPVSVTGPDVIGQRTTPLASNPVAPTFAVQEAAATQSDLAGLFSKAAHSPEGSKARREFLNSLNLCEPQNETHLIPLMLGGDLELVGAVMDTVSRLASPKGVISLAAMGTEASLLTDQRTLLLKTLASIRNPLATEGLIKVVLSDVDSDTRRAAARSLAKMGSAEAVAGFAQLALRSEGGDVMDVFDMMSPPPDAGSVLQAMVSNLPPESPWREAAGRHLETLGAL